MTRRIDGVRAGVDEQSPLGRAERAEVDRVLATRVLGHVAPRQIKVVAAIREEDGPAVCRLPALLVDPRDRFRDSPFGGDAVQALPPVPLEQDHAVAVPGPASRITGDVADVDRRSPRHGDLLQLVSGEEPDEARIGGPEGILPSFGPGNGPRLRRLEVPEPQLRTTVRA